MNTKTDSRKNAKDYKAITNRKRSNLLNLITEDHLQILGNVEKSGWTWINYCFWKIK